MELKSIGSIILKFEKFTCFSSLCERGIHSADLAGASVSGNFSEKDSAELVLALRLRNVSGNEKIYIFKINVHAVKIYQITILNVLYLVFEIYHFR